MPIVKNKYIAIGIFIFSLLLVFQKVKAEEIKTVYLDNETVQKGYTVVSSESQFKLGILPGALEKEISVTVQSLSNYSSFPKDTEKVSSVYEFDLINKTPLTLSQPLNLSLEYQSQNYAPKSIYYFDQNRNGWIALPSVVSFDTNTIQSKIWLKYAQLVVLERSDFRINLNEETLKKGFTTSNPENQSFELGIFPNAIDQEATVILKTLSLGIINLPEGLEAISDCYSFELKTEKPVQFFKPLVLSIKINQSDNHKKQIYFYDSNKETWIPLPSQTVSSEERVRAFIHLPYAKIVVLKNPQIMEEGFASWYRSLRHPFGAASNDYPYDTILRVTNLSNEKSVIVRVVSGGPFIARRIIDLAHKAFQAIAYLYQDGVIWVKVESL